jgi:hypothetical protein
MRFRNVFVGIGSLLTFLLLLMSDPDGGFVENLPFGSATVATIVILASSILYIGLLHFARKGLFDYLDLEVFFKKALQTPEGAGYALIAVAIAMVAISIVIFAATN